jgi:hypothetical protein
MEALWRRWQGIQDVILYLLGSQEILATSTSLLLGYPSEWVVFWQHSTGKPGILTVLKGKT